MGGFSKSPDLHCGVLENGGGGFGRVGMGFGHYSHFSYAPTGTTVFELDLSHTKYLIRRAAWAEMEPACPERRSMPKGKARGQGSRLEGRNERRIQKRAVFSTYQGIRGCIQSSKEAETVTSAQLYGCCRVRASAGRG